MTHLFPPNAASDAQKERLRELAKWPGMPAEARDYVEQRIADGLTVEEALELIGQLGKRIERIRREEFTAR